MSKPEVKFSIFRDTAYRLTGTSFKYAHLYTSARRRLMVKMRCTVY